MTGIGIHHPHGNSFDRFLYASVGEDRNGYVVTVLSTLARLGLDPWKEASELAALSHDAAGNRLSAVLSGFPDVPAVVLDHASIAQELVQLLPERSTPLASRIAGPPASKLPSISRNGVFAILTILVIIAQAFFAGIGGSGE